MKTYYLSKFLIKISDNDTSGLVNLIQGKIFYMHENINLGISSRLILKAISKSSGATINDIERMWRKVGDLGQVAYELFKNKAQSTLFSKDLTVSDVYDSLKKIPSITGVNSIDKKIQIISGLLSNASALEAKYIVKTVLEEMRMGVGEGLIRDSILWAYFSDEIGIKFDKENICLELDEVSRKKYNEYSEIIQNAYDITNDYLKVILKAKKGIGELKNVSLIVGNPIKVMLAQKVNNSKDAIEKLGVPVQVEFKYDGFRIQAHKKDLKIRLFTRRLEEVTLQFPEIVEYLEKNVKGDEFILDCEAVGYDKDSGKYMPFQHISQRIRRKHNISLLKDKLPVELNVFDIIYLDGKSFIETPLNKRVKILDKILTEEKKKIVFVESIISSDEKEINDFYNKALDAGEEGVIIKKYNGQYKPGKRVGGWVKLKPVMEPLDVVITKAHYGEGKRSKWFTSFTICVKDSYGEFLEIGKVGTGIKELSSDDGVSFEKLSGMIEPLIVKKIGREVLLKPSIVIEVSYEEIQKSFTYSSGYALRFPRLVRLREDRISDDCSDLEVVEDLYFGQKR